MDNTGVFYALACVHSAEELLFCINIEAGWQLQFKIGDYVEGLYYCNIREGNSEEESRHSNGV
jgi:hypothetical protein